MSVPAAAGGKQHAAQAAHTAAVRASSCRRAAAHACRKQACSCRRPALCCASAAWQAADALRTPAAATAAYLTNPGHAPRPLTRCA